MDELGPGGSQSSRTFSRSIHRFERLFPALEQLQRDDSVITYGEHLGTTSGCFDTA